MPFSFVGLFIEPLPIGRVAKLLALDWLSSAPFLHLVDFLKLIQLIMYRNFVVKHNHVFRVLVSVLLTGRTKVQAFGEVSYARQQTIISAWRGLDLLQSRISAICCNYWIAPGLLDRTSFRPEFFF